MLLVAANDFSQNNSITAISNLETWKACIKYTELPKTLRDAVDITRAYWKFATSGLPHYALSKTPLRIKTEGSIKSGFYVPGSHPDACWNPVACNEQGFSRFMPISIIKLHFMNKSKGKRRVTYNRAHEMFQRGRDVRPLVSIPSSYPWRRISINKLFFAFQGVGRLRTISFLREPCMFCSEKRSKNTKVISSSTA